MASPGGRGARRAPAVAAPNMSVILAWALVAEAGSSAAAAGSAATEVALVAFRRCPIQSPATTSLRPRHRSARRSALSARATSGSRRAPVSPISGSMSCAPTSTPTRSRGCQAGEIPIVEDGLDEIVADAVAGGRLRFVVGAAQAAADADVVFLCVPTPQDEDGSADLSYIEAAAERDRAGAAAGRGRRQQVDRSGRLGARRRARAASGPTWRSSPIRSSCARARRCTTSCIPTAS